MIQQILGKIFQEWADRCNSGTCNLTSEELDDTIELMQKINQQDLNIHEVAKELSVDQRTIQNWIKRGWIPDGTKRPGKKKSWNKIDIEKYKQSMK